MVGRIVEENALPVQPMIWWRSTRYLDNHVKDGKNLRNSQVHYDLPQNVLQTSNPNCRLHDIEIKHSPSIKLML